MKEKLRKENFEESKMLYKNIMNERRYSCQNVKFVGEN